MKYAKAVLMEMGMKKETFAFVASLSFLISVSLFSLYSYFWSPEADVGGQNL